MPKGADSAKRLANCEREKAINTTIFLSKYPSISAILHKRLYATP
jgi:hypothetical protein